MTWLCATWPLARTSARHFATSQPAVSRSIADLEAALGVALVERSPHGIEPTAYGRALVRRGLVVFDELMNGVKDIEFIADPSAGELRIGASIAVAVGFIAGIVDRLSVRYPRVSFNVLATYTTSAYRALAERQVDLLVVHVIEPIDTERMNAEVLLDDPHVVVAGSHSAWTRRRRLTLGELMNEPWTLPRPGAPYGAVVRAPGAQGPADRFADDGQATGHHYLEKPPAQPDCRSLHRTCARIRRVPDATRLRQWP